MQETKAETPSSILMIRNPTNRMVLGPKEPEIAVSEIAGSRGSETNRVRN
jgi:hypothetical protein